MIDKIYQKSLNIVNFRLAEGANCAGFLQDPQNRIQIIQDDPLNLDPSPSQKFVQISPQRIKLFLRPGIEFKFDFEVARSKQFPVDLYYLMDLSNSMSDDKDTIVRMGQELVNAVQNITHDFQIGFGSFVDKEVMPFISLVPQDNCQLDTGCPQPYSFQHQMKLSPDASLFQQRVANAPISGKFVFIDDIYYCIIIDSSWWFAKETNDSFWS